MGPLSEAGQSRGFLSDIKARYSRVTIYQLMIISLSLLVAVNSFNYPQLLASAPAALASVFIFHYAVSKLRNKAQISYESAAITGLLVALILVPNSPYALVIASLAAVLSKLIKLNSRHIFNPAMAGVLAAVLFTGSGDAWLGASQLLPVLILGLLVAQKYRRFHLVVPFIATHASLSILHKLYYNTHPVYHDVFGGVVYFSAFFMILEPKTAPITKNARIAYGITSAVIIFALGLLVPKYAITGGLLISNILVQPIEKFIK
ncbi:MAG: RnfABCDGE type electron transport complex subunit D [Candidatus Aenigmarchaeota archaeon]|nr:RnfABCDGE type electron transport complex subunit D [Candidatus Aenigmarchaeota archaeon]